MSGASPWTLHDIPAGQVDMSPLPESWDVFPATLPLSCDTPVLQSLLEWPARELFPAMDVDAALVEPPVVCKRRRMVKKQPRPEEYSGAEGMLPPAELHAAGERARSQLGRFVVAPLAAPGLDTLWSAINPETFLKMQEEDPRGRYFMIYRLVRKWLQTKAAVIDKTNPTVDEMRILNADKDWKRQGIGNRSMVCKAIIEETKPAAEIATFIHYTWISGSDGDPGFYFFKGKSVLLTYNGDWGLLPQIDSGQSLTPSSKSIAEFCLELAQLKGVLDLWRDFLATLQTTVVGHHIERWSCSLELCPTQFLSGNVRVHAHVFLSSVGKDIRLPRAEVLAFREHLPHVCKNTIITRGRNADANAGHYYLLSPKIGTILATGNTFPHLQFQINPSWVWAFVSSEKMLAADAQAEFLRIGRGSQRNIADLAAVTEERLRVELDATVRQVQRHLSQFQSRFRVLPQVMQWLRTYTVGVHNRKPILVLVGPSGVGKSAYIRSLFPPGAVLELNCSGLRAVHLSGFDNKKTQAIFWDELSVDMVLMNRKLFQHPATMIDLGQSPTAAHVKSYWVNAAVSCIASNKWFEELLSLTPGDRDWISANTVTVSCDFPLYVMPEDSQNSVQL